MGALLFPGFAAPTSRPAVKLGDEYLTQTQLVRRARAHLAGLVKAGLNPGDRVGVWTKPTLDTVITLSAQAAAGYISVPLNPKLGPKERDHILSDAAPKLVLENAYEENPDEYHVPEWQEISDQPALILYTSGTTGPPKGALITARNIAANLDGLAEAWQWDEQDCIVHSLPLFHVHGLVLGLFGCLRRGGCLRWVPRFSPQAIATELEASEGILFAVPTMYYRIAEALEGDLALREQMAKAKRLVSGSAGLPMREHDRIRQLTGQAVFERYGLTETLICCAVPAAGGPRPGLVGPPVPGVELRLVDEHREPTIPSDGTTIGEVAVRGKSVFRGYLGRPDATSAVMSEQGWFFTGDLATRNPDGSVRHVGRRATDLIKTGGYKVGAGEVEAALLDMPGVAEAAVIGRPDPDLGERIIAFIVCRDGADLEADTLIEGVASELTPHKRPREIHFLPALPRNAMGKVQKKLLPS